jgi:hypothetical protein
MNARLCHLPGSGAAVREASHSLPPQLGKAVPVADPVGDIFVELQREMLSPGRQRPRCGPG